MKKTHSILGGILVIALLFSMGIVTGQETSSAGFSETSIISEDIAPYNGTIGADNPMHGQKLAMEDLDETFTFNDTQRVEKRLDHAQLRIAEIRQELDLNRTISAERALDLYLQKLNLTEGSIATFGTNATGLLHAQEMLARHQEVLANLVLLHPDNTGLARAYNNSILLEQHFGEKTEIRFDRVIEKNNKIVLRAVKLEIRNQTGSRNNNATSVSNGGKGKDSIQDSIKDQKDPVPADGNIPSKTGLKNESVRLTKNPQEDKGSSQNKGKNGHD